MNSQRLEITRFLSADCQTVFEAWTDPVVLAEWFFAGEDWAVDVECDLRVGGEYALTMRTPDGDVYWHRGIYREIDPSRRLVFTWNSAIIENSLVTVTLSPDADGTRLELVHDFLESTTVRDAHAGGWTACLANLERRHPPG